MDLVKQIQSVQAKNSKKSWARKKIIHKCELKKISVDFVLNLFAKVFGYPIEIDNLDRPTQYFNFELY